MPVLAFELRPGQDPLLPGTILDLGDGHYIVAMVRTVDGSNFALVIRILTP